MNHNDRVDLGHLAVAWDGARTERLLTEVKSRIERRARVRRLALGGAALAGASVAVLLLVGRPTSREQPVAESAQTPGLLRLAEGATIRLAPGATDVRVLAQGPSLVQVEAVRGTAAYDVPADPRRAFEVRAGTLTLRVLGAAFTVERRAEGAFVAVSRGKLELSWRGDDDRGERTGPGLVVLGPGESGVFPPPSVAPAAALDPVASPVASKEPPPPARAYRSRVFHRDYRGAYSMLARHPALAGDTVEELLIAADVARLSEHPAEAVPHLKKILRDHPRDERAYQAAFTLGRTYARLGDARAAMNTFARVRSDWPGNPLAEDALVRQAEAAARLGDRTTAQRLAEEYERAYPAGRRRAEVWRYGRGETTASSSASSTSPAASSARPE